MASVTSANRRLLAAALAYPGAHEDHPWGETVVKVKGKVFVFLGHAQEKGFGCSLKLPFSSGAAMLLPFASPTGYGLGKSGWVSSSFAPGEDVPDGLLLEWLDESYRAVAPKRLSATVPPFGEAAAAPPAKRPAVKRKALEKKPIATKKPAARKPPGKPAKKPAKKAAGKPKKAAR
jgi:predicted DNA-binding protein (MmcQ/YjbR family)